MSVETMEAGSAGQCAECNGLIAPGDEVKMRGEHAVHPECAEVADANAFGDGFGHAPHRPDVPVEHPALSLTLHLFGYTLHLGIDR